MKSTLIWKAQRSHEIFRMQPGPFSAIEDWHPGFRTGFNLIIELRGRCARGKDQVTVKPSEIAADPFSGLNLLGSIDCGGKTLVEQSRHIASSHFDEFRVEVIERGGEVSGSPRTHSAADLPAIEHDYRAPALRQLVSDR